VLREIPVVHASMRRDEKEIEMSVGFLDEWDLVLT
jgi:hypothetical protein